MPNAVYPDYWWLGWYVNVMSRWHMSPFPRKVITFLLRLCNNLPYIVLVVIHYARSIPPSPLKSCNSKLSCCNWTLRAQADVRGQMFVVSTPYELNDLCIKSWRVAMLRLPPETQMKESAHFISCKTLLLSRCRSLWCICSQCCKRSRQHLDTDDARKFSTGLIWSPND